jgi:hypothetical protein
MDIDERVGGGNRVGRVPNRLEGRARAARRRDLGEFGAMGPTLRMRKGAAWTPAHARLQDEMRNEMRSEMRGRAEWPGPSASESTQLVNTEAIVNARAAQVARLA